LLVSLYHDGAADPITGDREFKYKDIYWGDTPIGADEYAEVTHVCVIPPENPTTLDPAGDFNIQLRTDGELQPYLKVPVGKDVLVAPIAEKVQVAPRDLNLSGRLNQLTFTFGESLTEAIKRYLDTRMSQTVYALKNRTPKFKDSADIVIDHISDITQPFRVDIYGVKYPKKILEEADVAVASTEFKEPHRKKRVGVVKSIRVSPANWTKLPGGKAQDTPKIWSWCNRWTNAATVREKDYYLNYVLGNVAVEEQNTYFRKEETDGKCYIISEFGVRYNANLLDVCFLDIDKDAHPPDRIPSYMLGYGWSYGQAPEIERPRNWGTYYLMPRRYWPFSIGPDEEGGAVIRSRAGTSIAANTLKGAFAGCIIVYR